ncbi:MAG: hypothetical protein ABJB40_01905 [Acidobacteriota bacterium]
MTKVIFNIFLFAAALITPVIPAVAQGIVRKAAGPDAAAIQGAVAQYRNDLGTLNPNVAQTFPSGRREINWDGVPDGFASPNTMPANFFNANSPRGAVFSTACESATFRISAKLGNPTNTPVRFGEIDPSYTDTFKAFSPQRLFTVVGGNGEPCSTLSVNFFAAGTNIPAETTGFGVVFSDVDIPGHVRFVSYDRFGNVLEPGVITAERSNDGFSFIGVSYPEAKIARVDIESGKTGLLYGILDSKPGKDVVAMDDFLYGEPQPIQ